MGETMSTALAVDDDLVFRSLPDVVVTDLTAVLGGRSAQEGGIVFREVPPDHGEIEGGED